MFSLRCARRSDIGHGERISTTIPARVCHPAGENSSPAIGRFNQWKKDGTFIDTLGFGRPVVAFPTGSYALERQIYTLDPGDDSVQGRVIRVNCLDFEFTELTVTNVTSQGPNAVCKRVTH